MKRYLVAIVAEVESELDEVELFNVVTLASEGNPEDFNIKKVRELEVEGLDYKDLGELDNLI